MSREVKLAVIDLDDRRGVNRVILRLNIERAAAYIDKSYSVIFIILRMKRIFLCINVNDSVCDSY